jgi:hypothetical protein
MTPEAKVKAKIQKILKAHDCLLHHAISALGLVVQGVPDFLLYAIRDCFIGIEAKSGDNKANCTTTRSH